MPATSAAHNRLLFFFFLLRPFTVLIKKTRAVKQSVFLDVYDVGSQKRPSYENFWSCLHSFSVHGWLGGGGIWNNVKSNPRLRLWLLIFQKLFWLALLVNTEFKLSAKISTGNPNMHNKMTVSKTDVNTLGILKTVLAC